MSGPGSPSEQAYTLASLTEEVRSLASRVTRQEARSSQRLEEIQSALGTALQALELIHDDDPGARRRLQEARSEPCYQDAFAVDDPLVSVVIPTWNRVDTLIERAIPSALGQTHPNVEVIVVGDSSPPDIGAAIEKLNDARVSYHNLTIRGPYPDDRYKAWLASGTPGFNAGVKLARGLWIAALGDDDAFVPQHLERLLAKARAERLEFVYGYIRPRVAAANQDLMGGFPPAYGQIGLQAALYHAGLRFLELELGHEIFDTPNDWGLVYRMMRIGVRMGMIDEVAVDLWPSMRNYPEPQAQQSAEETAYDPEQHVSDLEAENDHLRAQAAALSTQLDEVLSRVQPLDALAGELTRQLEEVRRSRSWRFTAPLRRMRSGL
jgi:hypothetical protein